MPHRGAIEAAILAGGQSQRMGRDKAWLRLRDPAGPTLIEALIELLRPEYEPLRILAGESPEPYAALGLAVQPDLRPRSGPLGGIHTALSTAERDIVLVVACDLPFLTRGFLRGLSSLLSGHDAVVPRPGDVPVPVCALYSRRCLPALEARLQGGDLKAADFLDDLSVYWVEGEELARLNPQGNALFNLNTPEDLEKAQSILRAVNSKKSSSF
ncbi:MAG: molybdenum cofactor guanylyltransferase [Vicinamibacteria bacterium]